MIFAEYAMDVADACHAQGVQTVAVTAGYIHAEPRREFYAKMDAANVDLKGFTDDFYLQDLRRRICSRCSTRCVTSCKETDVWIEITTLLIPGQERLRRGARRAMCEWIREHLGPDVPLHFTAFHPDYKMTDIAAHAAGDAARARARSRCATGCSYVYTGNVHDASGGSTYCPACGEAADRARLVRHPRLPRSTDDGACGHCGTRDPGPLPEVRQAVRPAPHPGQAGAASLASG